ncbi:site-specific recombinase XerD, partial [Bradyrhizobium diazoefficiens]
EGSDAARRHTFATDLLETGAEVRINFWSER